MDPLIAALLRPEAFDHPVQRLELLQTHISWIVLTGAYAYKIKKPVDLGFVDFSSLAKRRHFCQEELRLNRRLAPDLYLGVVEIHGPTSRARLFGDTEVIEVAVRMHQFQQRDLLPAVLGRRPGDPFLPGLIEELAGRLALFHASADRALPASEGSSAAQVRRPAEANLAVLEGLHGADRFLPPLRGWCEAEGRRLETLFEARHRQGHVRECHGDLHLGNLVLHQGRITVFDCLEFNPTLRWIDVISDIAFLGMDLCRARRADLAARLLNRWLEHSGDYAGLRLWRWYVSYRALVRAKVTALRLADPAETSRDQRRHWRADLRAYLRLASAATRPAPPLLLITHGLSGSGKSHWAQLLAQRQGWIRIRSDVERLRLFGRWGEPVAAPLSGDAYRDGVTTLLYERHLLACCDAVLEAGLSLVCDATFLQHQQRQRYQQLAERRGARFAILACRCDPALARERIVVRRGLGLDPSQADPDVLERQRLRIEALRPEERRCAVEVDTTAWVEPGSPASPTTAAAATLQQQQQQLERLIERLQALTAP
jgi:aminoglycoside phosphotransferase family enzyme/predicted kinase